MKKLALSVVVGSTALLVGCTTMKDNFGIFAGENQRYEYSEEVPAVRPHQEPMVRVEQSTYPIPSATSCACTPSTLPAAEKKAQSAALLLPPGSRLVGATEASSAPRVTKPAATTSELLKVTPPTSVAVARVKQIQTNDGVAALRLNVPTSKAWEAVSKAITMAGFRVLDRDTSAGAFYMLDTPATGGLIKSDTPIYQIHLANGVGDTTDITLLQENGKNVAPEISAQVLGKLMSQLAGDAL